MTLTPKALQLRPLAADFGPPLRSGMLAVLRSRSAIARQLGLWRSLVARLVRDEEAAGSNPVSPTM